MDRAGLVHLRARYYAPYFGAFITKDPVEGNINQYRYAVNNPINWTDSSGHCADPSAINYDGNIYGRECIYPEPPAYTYWYSGEYGGCQMCHTSQSVWNLSGGTQFIPTNEQLETLDILYRTRYAQFALVELGSLACVTGIGAISACLGNPGCVSNVIRIWMALDIIDDTVVQIRALSGDPNAQAELIAMYQTGAFMNPVEGPQNLLRATLRGTSWTGSARDVFDFLIGKGVLQSKYADAAETFEGPVRLIKLEDNLVVLRYWSEGMEIERPSPWFSPEVYLPNQARADLALPEYNSASRVTRFVIPQDTYIIVGEVSPMVEKFGEYAQGGGIQIYLPDPNKAIPFWGEP